MADKVNPSKWQVTTLLACIVVLAGCGKSKTSEAAKARMPELAALRQAIPSPTPEVAAVLDRLEEELRFEPGMA